MRPSENVQFSERFRTIFKSFSIVFGTFWIVFALFFASFRRRRCRNVVFGVVVRSIDQKNFEKDFQKKVEKNLNLFLKNFDTWQCFFCQLFRSLGNLAPDKNPCRQRASGWTFGRTSGRRACRQRRRKKNHLIEAAPFGRLDQM